jgi:hypothetical protein
MKISLNFYQQAELLNAYSALDGYDAVSPGVANGPKTVRVPFKLGAKRKILVKNMAALKAKIEESEETRKSLFRENFPDVPEGQEVKKDDRPVEFAKYAAALHDAQNEKEEIELQKFAEADIYNDNDFPSGAIVVLEGHGLIGEAV